MICELKDKKYIFFDVGYTLLKPKNDNWFLTEMFFEVASDRYYRNTDKDKEKAFKLGYEYLDNNHHIQNLAKEEDNFFNFYSILSKNLHMKLSEEELYIITYDRVYNMDNYIPYPNIKYVLGELSKSYTLGIISDNWPSVRNQLKAFDIIDYFSSFTISCELGTFKPDKRMYEDALKKSGCDAADTVFIDDSLDNLIGAEKLGITPILITENSDNIESFKNTKYRTINSIEELLLEE